MSPKDRASPVVAHVQSDAKQLPPKSRRRKSSTAPLHHCDSSMSRLNSSSNSNANGSNSSMSSLGNSNGSSSLAGADSPKSPDGCPVPSTTSPLPDALRASSPPLHNNTLGVPNSTIAGLMDRSRSPSPSVPRPHRQSLIVPPDLSPLYERARQPSPSFPGRSPLPVPGNPAALTPDRVRSPSPRSAASPSPTPSEDGSGDGSPGRSPRIWSWRGNLGHLMESLDASKHAAPSARAPSAAAVASVAVAVAAAAVAAAAPLSEAPAMPKGSPAKLIYTIASQRALNTDAPEGPEQDGRAGSPCTTDRASPPPEVGAQPRRRSSGSLDAGGRLTFVIKSPRETRRTSASLTSPDRSSASASETRRSVSDRRPSGARRPSASAAGRSDGSDNRRQSVSLAKPQDRESGGAAASPVPGDHRRRSLSLTTHREPRRGSVAGRPPPVRSPAQHRADPGPDRPDSASSSERASRRDELRRSSVAGPKRRGSPAAHRDGAPTAGSPAQPGHRRRSSVAAGSAPQSTAPAKPGPRYGDSPSPGPASPPQQRRRSSIAVGGTPPGSPPQTVDRRGSSGRAPDPQRRASVAALPDPEDPLAGLHEYTFGSPKEATRRTHRQSASAPPGLPRPAPQKASPLPELAASEGASSPQQHRRPPTSLQNRGPDRNGRTKSVVGEGSPTKPAPDPHRRGSAVAREAADGGRRSSVVAAHKGVENGAERQDRRLVGVACYSTALGR